MSAALRTRLVALAGAIACASFAHAQTIETWVGGNRFQNSPGTDTPLLPGDTAATPDGKLLVVDRFSGNLFRFDPASGTASVLPESPQVPVFQYLTEVTADSSGNVYAIQDYRLVRLDLDSGGSESLSTGGFEAQSSGCFGASWSPVQFSFPADITTDESGQIYVVDSADNRVCRVSPSGNSMLFAGNGNYGFSGDGGPAQFAEFADPRSVAVDGEGNVYVLDAGNSRVRMISAADGTISTIAGGGQIPATVEGTLATDVYFDWPTAMTVDSSGNLYVVDSGAARVYVIDISQRRVHIAAGDGSWEYSGDGGPAREAGLSSIDSITELDNSIYIASTDARRVRRFPAVTGYITTVLGNGEAAYCGDNAPRLNTCFDGPEGLAFDGQNNLFIADRFNGRIRKVDAITGITTTIAGQGSYAGHSGDGGPAVDAGFSHDVRGIATDSAGNLYIATGMGARIRRIDAASGVITTIAGTGEWGFTGDGGPATAARLNSPNNVLVDPAGNVYISDYQNNRVRKISAATGIITTVAQVSGPGSLALDAEGNLYIATSTQPRIWKLQPNGGLGVIAGNGTYFMTGDAGPATQAGLGNNPQILVEPNGDILVTANWAVRRIVKATGNIELLTFNMYSADGRTIQSPSDALLGADGNLYVSDISEQRVYRISGLPTAPLDTTPPTINPVVQGTLGDNGWYRSNVRVTFFTTDEESAVERSGCDTVDVTQDTAGVTFTCTASSGGGTATESVTIKRDATAPTLSFAAPSPAANANGWNGSPVSIGFTTSDALSGVAGTSRPSPLLFSSDGAGLTLDVVVTDQAGNAATFNSPAVNIDQSAPVIQMQAGGTTGTNGWYRSNVQIRWLIDDSGSLESVIGCNDVDVTADTAGTEFTCTATSTGGTTTSSFTVKRDTTAPTLTFGTASPAPNANGWNKTNVSIPFTAGDALSGVASTSTPSPLVVSAEGAGVTGQVVVTDQAGNAATFTSIARNIDKTAPVIAITAPASNATYGFYQDVVADFACTDVSLLTCSGTVADGALVNTRTAGARTFRVTSTDRVSFSASLTHNFTVESTFNWEGFLAPASAPPTLNLVPRGALVPIRWKLPDGRGGFVSNTASFASATVGSLSCGNAAAVPLNDTASGPAGISYDASTGTFTYNWQTGANWSGCRKLTIKLRDNSTHELRFRFQ